MHSDSSPSDARLPQSRSSCDDGLMDEIRQRVAELLERVRDVQVRL
jgi:hypothetical protein